jgi:LacI family transcriptional regulator
MAGTGSTPSVPPGRRPTIKDVARLAGVDQSLVSRVVNDDPKASASAATRAKILAAVDQLGYRANVIARGFRVARTSTIGLLLPDFENPLYNSIIRGVEAKASELGYGIVLGAPAEGAQEETFVRLLQEGRVDGLLAASGTLRNEFMREVFTAGAGPVVLVNRRVRGVKASVVVDDHAGAQLAVRHLADLGHTTVAGLFGPAHIDTASRRRGGFEAACAEAGVEAVAIDMAEWDMKAGYAAAAKAIREIPRATAMFASTILMGVGALSAARDLGRPVPETLSVIALHDSPLAEFLGPPLTTVAMPTREMGREAAALLVDMIEGRAARQLMVSTPPRLATRRSTAAPAHLKSNG